MPLTFSPESRAQPLQQLNTFLNSLTVQELRGIAHAWDWPLRGNLKSLIVEQMLGQLANSEQMAAGFRALPPIQREALMWLSGPLGKGDLTTALQNALRLGSGLNLAKEDAGQALATLHTRGLLLFTPYHGYSVPALYNEWLPGTPASGLLHARTPDAGPAMGASKLNGQVEQLLMVIQADKPRLAAGRPTSNEPIVPALRNTTLIQARSGALPEETLHQWGYSSSEDLALVRMLLDVLVSGGLLLVNDHAPNGKRLEVDQKALAIWRDQALAAHQHFLRDWWLTAWQKVVPNTSPHLNLSWNELDMALTAVRGYHFRQSLQWVTRDQLEREVGQLRTWLISLVLRLQPDTWFNFNRFCELVYHLQRDLLQWYQYYPTWHWYRDQTPLDPAQMNLETWQATYGTLIANCFNGPMRWLGFLQIAIEGDQVVAFCRPSVVIERSDAQLPVDTVSFDGANSLIVRNIWQAGELRQLVRQIAVESERGRESTIYHLDTTTFREALRAGRSVNQILQAFTDAGFPLPAPMTATLEGWQTKAGRHQIYDNLALIEFGDDVILQEILATTSLGRAQVYAVSPRCLVILDPATVQPLVDELRRKGYTPQVVS